MSTLTFRIRDLSPELQSMISSLLAPTDLESLRLSCRQMAAAGHYEITRRLPKLMYCNMPHQQQQHQETSSQQRSNQPWHLTATEPRIRDIMQFKQIFPNHLGRVEKLNLVGVKETTALALEGLVLPGLRFLSVALFTTESVETLLTFISAHAATLKVLRITQWTVKASRTGRDKGYFHFLRQLRDVMHLERLLVSWGVSLMISDHIKHPKRIFKDPSNADGRDEWYRLCQSGLIAMGQRVVGDAIDEYITYHKRLLKTAEAKRRKYIDMVKD